MTELERIQKEQQDMIEARKRKSELPDGVLPQPQRAEHIVPKTFREKWTNYWYHYKWATFGGAFFGALGIMLILQLAFPTRYDTSFSVVSVLPLDSAQSVLTAPLLQAVPDYDKNGKNMLELQFYQIPTLDENGNTLTDPQIVMANTTRLMGNMAAGIYFLYMVDDAGYTYLSNMDMKFLSLDGKITGAKGDRYALKGTKLADRMGYPKELEGFSLVFLDPVTLGDHMKKKNTQEACKRQWDFFEKLVAIG